MQGNSLILCSGKIPHTTGQLSHRSRAQALERSAASACCSWRRPVPSNGDPAQPGNKTIKTFQELLPTSGFLPSFLLSPHPEMQALWFLSLTLRSAIIISLSFLFLIPWLGRFPGERIGYPLQYSWASLVAQDGKESACNMGDLGLRHGLERSPGEGNGNSLQYSGLENSMDRETWWAIYSPWGHKSQIWPSGFHFHINISLNFL